VLLVVSQTTKKSVTPLRPLTSLKNGSTRFLNCALVNSSLNSNSCAFAAVDIAFSIVLNNLRTLIRSNADGFESNVLSPKRSVPSPGNETIGLTLAL